MRRSPSAAGRVGPEAPDPGDLDPARLVELSQAGDVAAREALYRLHAHRVLAWARRLAPRGRDPEDIAHEVFIGIFSGNGGFRGDTSFDGWLFRITRNAAFRRRSIIETLTRFFDESTPEPASDPDEADPWVGTAIHEALLRLRPELREVIVLYEVEERSASEVAELLGLPEGTVRSRIRKARQALTQSLRRYGVDSTSWAMGTTS